MPLTSKLSFEDLFTLNPKGKYCEVGPLFYPTEDVDADLAYIMSTYHDANPKYPENFSNGN